MRSCLTHEKQVKLEKTFCYKQRNCDKLSSIKKTKVVEECILNSTKAKIAAMKKTVFVRHPYNRFGISCFIRALGQDKIMETS